MASSWTPKAQGEFGRIDQGYSVTVPRLAPDDHGESRNKTNAFLENSDGQRVWMWVNNVGADFSMAGSTAQSKKRRSFFPHNLTQPVMQIAGQTPNQYQAARLAEFIRDSQKAAIISDIHRLRLAVLAGGEATTRPIVKGRHDHIILDGYVHTTQRGSERFINAPDFQFDFVITKAYNFLGLHDETVRRVKFKSILDVIRHPGEFKFETGGILHPGSHDDQNDDSSSGNQGHGNPPPTPHPHPSP